MKPAILLLLVAAAGCASSPRQHDQHAERVISTELERMLRAWNSDSLDAHVRSYAVDATWTTANGLLRGKAAIQATLTTSFLRGSDLSGRLSFGPTEFRRLGTDYMMTHGSFRLDNLPSGRAITGQSTLVWKRTGARWEIIHDHSS
jgi:uncharacterized protein (TIGR02246 family)